MYAPSWPPSNDSNGIVTYTSYVAPALRNLGHEVFILTANCQKTDEHTINLQDFDGRRFWHRAAFQIAPSATFLSEYRHRLAAAIQYLVRDKGVEILEIEESFGFSTSVSGLGLIPVVVRLHGPWFLNGAGSLDAAREAREGAAIRAADFITAPSNYVLSEVRKKYNLPLDNRRLTAAVVPNPITIPNRKWKLESCNRNQLLFVGRFDRIKGGDIVLDAFAAVAREHPDLRLVFVGPDRGIDGKKFEQFAATVPAGIRSRIDFKGVLSRSEIDDLRLKSLVTIIASREEVFGYTALEAMALGCPVISSNAGGLPEVVGESVLMFSTGSDELAGAIRRVLSDPSTASRIGSSARQRAEAFSVTTAANHTADYYMQVVERHRSRIEMRPNVYEDYG